MDLETLEKIGLRPLVDMLKKLGGWPVLEGDAWDESKFSWEELNYIFREQGYSVDTLFDFAIGSDLKDSEWRTMYFDQPSLGMSREYLIKGLEEPNIRHYYTFMQKVAVLLGADPVQAQDQLLDSLNFEIKLANASLPRELRRNITALYHPMALSEISQLMPDLDWTYYVNRLLTKDLLQVDSSERIVVNTPGYFVNLTQILASEPKRNVANYMIWRAVSSSIGLLNKASRELAQELSRNITGKTDDPPRWKACISSASGSFSAAVGKLYLLKHFQHEAKEDMLEMVSDIKQEFKRILDEVSWMDANTKARAHAKLESIKEYIGYPAEIMNNANLEDLYKGLEINNETYFLNGVSMSIWSTNYHWSKLRERVDKTDWKRHANPAVVNAFYNALENSIEFPAGILQGHFFDKDRPRYMNYGAIGSVIGHEITHGFDDTGRQFDSDGNLNNWWEMETFKEYLNKTQCIIKQYGNYKEEDLNINLNGILTQGENIADNGGIKESYRAYERWTRRNGQEKTLPGLDLNPKQLFWLTSASNWCSKYRPKALEIQIRTGSHPPGKFR